MTITPTSYEVIKSWADCASGITDPLQRVLVDTHAKVLVSTAEAVGVDITADFIFGYIAALNAEQAAPGAPMFAALGIAQMFMDGTL